MKLCIFVILVSFAVYKLESAEIGSSRIIGGKPAYQSDWSFMVSIQNYTEIAFLWQLYPVYQHLCSGTLVADAKFITAAHCVAGITNFRNISIYAGVTNLQDTRGIRKLVKACVIGTTYIPGNPGIADIAICEVTEAFAPALVEYPALATPTTTPLKVTKVAITKDWAPTAPATVNSTVCKTAGWGSLSMVNLGTGLYSNALMELGVNLLDVAACNRMWPKVTLDSAGHLCSQMVAYSGNCFGDSGGPLLCANKQIATTIAGNTICAVGQPDIYTRFVTAYAAYP